MALFRMAGGAASAPPLDTIHLPCPSFSQISLTDVAVVEACLPTLQNGNMDLEVSEGGGGRVPVGDVEAGFLYFLWGALYEFVEGGRDGLYLQEGLHACI